MLVLVVAYKPKEGRKLIHQVCIYDSSTSTLIPNNTAGKTCYVGTSLRNVAAKAHIEENHKKVMIGLRRYLYTHPDGKPVTIDSLLAVYELYKLPPPEVKDESRQLDTDNGNM